MGRRNPNGYGCVTKLSGHRSRPWMVKVTIYDQEGKAKQTPVGYAATEAEAKILLAQYNNNPWDIHRETVTLVMLYNRWLKVKAPKLSDSNRSSLKSAFNHLAKYYGMKYRSIKSFHMQDAIDSCGKGYSTQAAIKNLWGHLDRFAFELNIIERMYSQLTTAPPIPDTNRQPFTLEEIDTLWKDSKDEWTQTVLIFLYTGFRLNELLIMKKEQVDLKEWTFTGGIKTRNGKDRIVPIHERIRPFVQSRMQTNSTYIFELDGKKVTQTKYYEQWKTVMERSGIDHTPHECRHTFETLLDNAGGNRKCIDLLMGHKSKDTGNRVYNHKTLDQLRETIALLK
jgi:integrase